jgi:hypothetical protein
VPLLAPDRRLAAALLPALALALALTLAAIAGCGGGGDDGGDSSVLPADTPLAAVVVNSEVVAGPNRFILGIFSQDRQQLIGADVSLTFYRLDAEDQAGEPVQARAVTYEKSYTHTHDDGTVEAHSAGESGVYVATATFAEAGQWAVEAKATLGDVEYAPVSTAFDVLPQARSVAIGAPAPRSQTLTLDDVEDVAEIDTSDPPVPEMHEMTIAEAVTSGEPSLIVFATPAFCLSQVCGPTKEIVDELFGEYGDRVHFVHVEPYDVARARSGEGLFRVQATGEWGLTSEPWVFIVDAAGNVAAKFEAIVTSDELTEALDAALSG